MLNYEYDAETEKKVIQQESHQAGLQAGLQAGIDLVARLLREGLTIDEAIAIARKTAAEGNPS